MKTLSIRCQYAYLICLGIKTVENRSWKTNYRGDLLIHSSGKSCSEIDLKVFPDNWLMDFEANLELPEDRQKKIRYVNKLDNFYKKLYKYYGSKNYEDWNKPDYLHSQAIIGKVQLVDITKDSHSEWSIHGNYQWVLKKPELFKIPLLFIKGKLQLWEYKNL